MSAVPSPTTSVDELVAQPPPDLPSQIKGTDIRGRVIHMNTDHIVMIIPGENYNIVHMTSGHHLQIVTWEAVP